MDFRKEIDKLCDYFQAHEQPEKKDFNWYMAKNDSVSAQKNIEEKLEELPDDILLKLNYGYILTKTGYAEKARDIFHALIYNPWCPIDIKYFAISNYMMCCDYLGIPNRDRIDIKQYYPAPQGDDPIVSESEKIILGYVTSDAFSHPVGRALLKILENHDRDKLEVNVFYSGDVVDDMAKKIMDNCDRMIYIGSHGQPGALSSRELYYKLREMKVEILIDCNGHTVGGSRLPLFCKRPCLCNVAMIGYPNSTMLDCFDMRVSSAIVTIDQSLWTEPVYNNPYGYMPYFKSVDCNEIQFTPKEKIIIGCISPIAKISVQDIQHYNGALLSNDRFQLIYARLGSQYSIDKTNWIMRQHSDNAKGRITFLNLKKQPYLKAFEMCDFVLDHINWSNQMLFQDAYSCGVPALLMDKPGRLPCSMLSRDFINQVNNNDTQVYGDENINNLQVLSQLIFNKTKALDTSKQWTRAFEDALDDLYKRKACSARCK
jgi:hypothetical protein